MVLFSQSTFEVRYSLICSGYSIPIIPFGVGTSLEGGIGALKGGISVDFSEMKKIWKLINLIWIVRLKQVLLEKN